MHNDPVGARNGRAGLGHAIAIPAMEQTLRPVAPRVFNPARSQLIDVRQSLFAVRMLLSGGPNMKGPNMTKDDTAKDAMAPLNNLMESIQEASSKMMPGFGPHWFETMNEVGAEMFAFMSERIKQDVQTQQDLLQAKGIAEVQQIQADFLKKAMEDYTAEMSKLMAVGKSHTDHATPV